MSKPPNMSETRIAGINDGSLSHVNTCNDKTRAHNSDILPKTTKDRLVSAYFGPHLPRAALITREQGMQTRSLPKPSLS